MSRSEAATVSTSQRTLHVKCATWDQVTTFTTRKLRRGKLLSMKVPFAAEPATPVTLGLELPNGLVLAIDGQILRASAVEGDPAKTWIEVELTGFTDDVFARLKDLVATARANAPEVPEPVAPRASAPQLLIEAQPADDRELFSKLSAELRRLRSLSVHEVLAVGRDAGPSELRVGWRQRVSKYHPDLFARIESPAISHLAEELTILCNRAYDRMRLALVAEGRGTVLGPTIAPPAGWLVGFDDLASTTSVAIDPALARPARAATFQPSAAAAASADPNAQGGEAFEQRARSMLGDGDAETAREVLAAALCVYPRSKPLRSLYYVASAFGAVLDGELMLATSQLEAAIAHYEQCGEAVAMLEHLRVHGRGDPDEIRRLFQ